MNPPSAEIHRRFSVEQTAFAAFNGIDRQPGRDPVQVGAIQMQQRSFAQRLHQLTVIGHIRLRHIRIRNIAQHFGIFDDVVIELPDRPRIVEFLQFAPGLIRTLSRGCLRIPQFDPGVQRSIPVDRHGRNQFFHGQRHPGSLFEPLPVPVAPFDIRIRIDCRDERADESGPVLNHLQVAALAAHGGQERRHKFKLSRSQRQAAGVKVVQRLVGIRVDHNILCLIPANPRQVVVTAAFFDDHDLGKLVVCLRENRYEIDRLPRSGLAQAQCMLRRVAVEKRKGHQIAVITSEQNISLRAFSDKRTGKR